MRILFVLFTFIVWVRCLCTLKYITLFTLSAEMHVDFAVHVFSSLKEFAILMITQFKYNCPNDGS